MKKQFLALLMVLSAVLTSTTSSINFNNNMINKTTAGLGGVLCAAVAVKSAIDSFKSVLFAGKLLFLEDIHAIIIAEIASKKLRYQLTLELLAESAILGLCSVSSGYLSYKCFKTMLK